MSDDLKSTTLDVIVPTEGQPLFGDSSEQFEADLHDFTLVVGDHPTRFQFSDRDYEEAGIDVAAMAPPLAFLRMLAAREPDRFLLSPERLLSHFDKDRLDHLFSVEEWRHPDEAEDELPSETPCFQEIAQVLAEGTPRAPLVCADEQHTLVSLVGIRAIASTKSTEPTTSTASPALGVAVTSIPGRIVHSERLVDGKWWADVTTAGEWFAHVTKYSGTFGKSALGLLYKIKNKKHSEG